MSGSFLTAAASRALDAGDGNLAASEVEVVTAAVRPTLGGREVDATGVNSGLLRCPRCTSRMLSKSGELHERQEPDNSLWVANRPACDAVVEAAAAAAVDDDHYEWTESKYTWWWMAGTMDDVDNLGLSRVVATPAGRLKLAMCCECNYGPFGYQLEDDPKIWLACDLLHQQDADMANDADDFKLPQGIDLKMLQGMIESGMATVQYHLSFEEQRLGMCLADADDGLGGVACIAFTELDGPGTMGPAEKSGKVEVGDKITRVNGRSTAGLDYGGVLDMVVKADRPVTIHFERKGKQQGQQPVGGTGARVEHQQWPGYEGKKPH